MAYTTIDDPSEYFQSAIWTGNASSRTITFTGNADMQPDMVWSKKRADAAQNHCITDTQRGVANIIFPDNADQESATQLITSMASDGFAINNNALINENSKTYVAWAWKANGGSSTGSAAESGDNPAYNHQANTTSGFSIITYTGTGANGVIPHGIGVAPKMVWSKGRNHGNNWRVGLAGTAIDFTDSIKLNENETAQDNATYWQDTAPSSTNISVGSNDNINNDGNTSVIYAWAEIQGFSKMGTYTGVGDGGDDGDGQYVWTGFTPAMVFIKRIDGANGNWHIYDSIRSTFNQVDDALQINTNNTEFVTSNKIDFLHNGFRLRGGNEATTNNDGTTYLYAAWAKHPAVTSEGVPATAVAFI